MLFLKNPIFTPVLIFQQWMSKLLVYLKRPTAFNMKPRIVVVVASLRVCFQWSEFTIPIQHS
jgi:hypothetical protein